MDLSPRESCCNRREPRAEYAETHRADIKSIAVFVEEAFFLVVKKGKCAGMHRERRALVGSWRFDTVRNRNPRGDARTRRQQEPGQCTGRFIGKATPRDKSCAHPEGIEILRRFRLGAAERAAHDLDPFECRRTLRDRLRLRDGKEDRLATTSHRNRVDRLGQAFRAGCTDGKNRVDLIVFDRPRKFREGQGYAPNRGRRHVVLSKGRVQKKLIVHFPRRLGLQNANLMPAQIVNRVQTALRRHEQHGRIPVHDQHGLTIRRHREIAAHDREIGAPFLERARRIRQIIDRDQFEANAVLFFGEMMRSRRQDSLIVAVARNRDSQEARTFKVVDCRADGGNR